MKLFVSLKFEGEDVAELICKNYLSQDCELAKKEAIDRDLSFSTPLKVNKDVKPHTIAFNTFNIPRQNLVAWKGSESELPWLKKDPTSISIRAFLSTASGYFQAIIPHENLSSNFEIAGFAGLEIDLIVMGKINDDDNKPVNEETIKCET